MIADGLGLEFIGTVFYYMWLLIKGTWPLWVALVVLAVLRVLAERAIDRRRAKRYHRDAELQWQASATPKHVTRDFASSLEALAALHESGALSDREWQRAKEVVLGNDASPREQIVSEIRGLHDLHKAGALSESEFNSKKWELLAHKA